VNWALLASQLLPGVVKLAWEALSAIVAGNADLAKRKAEEAALRQATKMAIDATLRAKAKK
jgi:hypothetical protein